MSIRENIAKWIAPGLKTDAEIRGIVQEEIKQAKMALPITASYDPKNEGYRRLSGSGGQLRDLSYVDQGRMFEIAYFMYDTSAMFKRLAHMDRGFLFSGDVAIESEDEDVQEIIDRFRDDVENRLNLDFPDCAMWLGILGEQCWPVTVSPQNGHVRLGYVDPGNISEVWVNPLNVKQIMRVDLQGAGGRSGQKYAAIRKDYNPYSKTFGKLVGDCFFFSINHPPNSPRGRSDYLTLFDWIDAVERYGYNYLERAEFMLNFVWDVCLKGMTEDQIREWVRNNPPPEPGSVRAHNENVEWDAVAPDIKATDFKSGFEMAKGFIMGAAGRPASWFGEGGKAYQTEADQFGQVPIRDLEQRQGYLKYVLQMVVQYAIDQAVIAGRLSEEKALEGFTISMPEISKKELTKLINGIPQLTTALSIAEEQRWIRKETAIRIFAYVCSYLGYDLFPQDEIDAAGKAPPDEEKDYDGRALPGGEAAS